MPRQAVTGWPSFVSVAPITPEDSATGPPHAAPPWLQLPPPEGAVNVLMPPSPTANSCSVRSRMTTSASPLFPFHPLATVDVPTVFPADESRVSKIDVGVAPRFQITWSTPSAVRASPSCAPGAVGPLIRFHGVDVAAEPAAAAAATRADASAAATSTMVCGRRMWRPPRFMG